MSYMLSSTKAVVPQVALQLVVHPATHPPIVLHDFLQVLMHVLHPWDMPVPIELPFLHCCMHFLIDVRVIYLNVSVVPYLHVNKPPLW